MSLDDKIEEESKNHGFTPGNSWGAGIAEQEFKRGAEFVQKELGWQPIETAPKDGTEVLIYTRFDDAHVACYNRKSLWHGEFGEISTSKVTHWMRIPKLEIE